jgi:Animal haem peroxidase
MAVWIRRGWLGAVDLVLLLVLFALQVFGLYGYITHQVLVPVWLWENQDYMNFIWPVYYHAHILLMAGHLYLWGPYLISRRFHRPGWSLYWTSFLIAYPLSTYPLLEVQRFAALHGGGAYTAVRVYAALLLLLFLVVLLVRRRQSDVVMFHLFSGLPIILLGLRGMETLGLSNDDVVGGLVVLHVAIAAYFLLTESAPGRDEVPDEPRRRSIAAGLVSLVLLIGAGAASIAYTPIHLFFAKQELGKLLDHVGYALKPVAPPLEDKTPPPDYLRFRTYDGTWNNVDHPEVGRAGTPLGRYIPESGLVARDVLAEPTVIQISERLLRQVDFRSAAPFNALAMAWVNFFVHDFYNRGVTDTQDTDPNRQYYKIPTGDGKFVYMVKLPSVNDDGHTHVTRVTHWFDASQVYGSDEATGRKLRTEDGKGARLQMDGEFLPMVDVRGAKVFLTGDTPRSSLHIGSLMMHHLWATEHNFIVDELQKAYPQMNAEELFQTARLIVAAEIVKVHSVEWTAELVGDPVSYQFFQKFWEQFGKDPYRKELYYAVSEEFVASYILHEIVPPTFDLVDEKGAMVERVDFVKSLSLLGGQDKLKEYHLANVFNSFGLNPMGLIHPFNVAPTFRRFTGLNFLFTPGGSGGETFEGFAGYVDLAAIPVARDRDARVPYYNDVRAKLSMPRLKSIREISNEPDVLQALEELYKGDVNKIEYIVGYKSEVRPSNWALTPTQVRTFLPVVIYRIWADRFYTQDFNAKTYTEFGMTRLKDVKLYDIIKRCYGPTMLPKDRNHPIFHQWNK